MVAGQAHRQVISVEVDAMQATAKPLDALDLQALSDGNKRGVQP